LLAVQGLGLSEVDKVFMVNEDLNWEGGAMEVVLPRFEGANDGKEFSVIDVIVSFSLRERLGEIGVGMPISIRVGLKEDSIRCMFRCVSSNGKGCREIWEMKNWFE